MTNLEWIKTLSEEEFADWLYDEWLHHLQYRWSSSRGGLIIWLKDRKTENSSEFPNNCEPQYEMGMGTLKCYNCSEYGSFKCTKCDGEMYFKRLEPKDEPQLTPNY